MRPWNRTTLTFVGSVAVLLLVSALGGTLSGPAPVSSGSHATLESSTTNSAPASAEIAPLPLPSSSPTVTILPDGTLTNASAPIAESGATYSLTSDYTGSILDQRNGSTLDGAGFRLTAPNGSTSAIEVANATSVHVVNFTLTAADDGLVLLGAADVTVTQDSFQAASWSVWAESTSGVGLSTLEAPGSEGIYGYGLTNFTLSGSDLSNSLVAGVDLVRSSSVSLFGDRFNGSVVGVETAWSNGVAISNCEVANSTVGLALSNSSDLALRSNDLSGDAVGAQFTLVDSVNLTQDYGTGGGTAVEGRGVASFAAFALDLTGFSVGLSLASTTSATVFDSDLSGSGTAAEFAGSSSVLLDYDNLSAFGSTGLSLTDSSSVVVSHDDLTSGTGSTATALRMLDAQDTQLLRNELDSNPLGLVDVGSRNLTVDYNSFTDSGSAGPVVSFTGDAQVTLVGNGISHAAGTAVQLEGVLGGHLQANTATSAGTTAMVVANTSGVELQTNFLEGAGSTSLLLQNSTGLTVWGNVAGGSPNGTGTGIWGDGISASELAFNNVTLTGTALSLTNSSGTDLLDNNATHSGVGVVLWGDVNCSLLANGFWNDSVAFSVGMDSALSAYHNNFGYDGGWVVAPAAGPMTWDAGYLEGGNFWSNLTAPDLASGPNQTWAGPDGIVDDPMPLGLGELDRYPLTVPWWGYYATFTESGVLLGTPWSLVVNGVKFSSAAPGPIVYPQTNGPGATLRWSVPPLSGYSLLSPNTSGPWPEPRTNSSFSIAFLPVYYGVTFQEYGLAAGTTWSVVVGSLPEAGPRAAIEVELANGTYSYIAGSVAGYNLTLGSGFITVAGPGLVVVVVYAALGTSATPAASGSSVPLLTLGAMVVLVGVAVGLVVWMRPGRPARPPPPQRWDPVPPGANSPPSGAPARRT